MIEKITSEDFIENDENEHGLSTVDKKVNLHRNPALPDSEILLKDLNRPMSDPVISDPLSSYLSRLKNFIPMKDSDQLELALRYLEDGDVSAAKVLTLTNLRLVVKIAKEYKRDWANLLDLIQEGNLGLATAVSHYDPYRGVKFTSYSQFWIRAMILNYLMNHSLPVRIGSSRSGRKLFYNLKKARRALHEQGYLNPTPSLIAEYLDVDESEVIRVAGQLDAPPVYMDAKANKGEGGTIGDLIADTSSATPEEIVAAQQASRKLARVIGTFGNTLKNEREKTIWFDRMISDEPKNLLALGQDYKVSKERIRQIEAGIRVRFKQYLLLELGNEISLNYLET